MASLPTPEKTYRQNREFRIMYRPISTTQASNPAVQRTPAPERASDANKPPATARRKISRLLKRGSSAPAPSLVANLCAKLAEVEALPAPWGCRVLMRAV